MLQPFVALALSLCAALLPAQTKTKVDSGIVRVFVTTKTITAHDTVVRTVTRTVHDTTVKHDTTKVVVRDTLVQHDSVTLRDTLVVRDTIVARDTLTVVRRDTLVTHDTVVVVKRDTLFVHDTVIVKPPTPPDTTKPVVPPPSVPAMYFNSLEQGCGTDPSIVWCDDFESGSWYVKNCDDANGSGGLTQTKGWCGTIYANPITPSGAVVCGGSGAAGTNCAASGGVHNGSSGGVNMADHNLGPNANGYNEIWLRYYIKPSSGYQYGAQKMITFNATLAGSGGISIGGSGSPFNDGAFDTCPVYDCNTTGEVFYYRQNQGAKLTLSQITGHWAYVEMHVKLNTPGQANGVWELWLNDCGVDGKCTGSPTLRSRYTSVKWQGPSDNKQIRSIWFENWANPGSIGTELYDQIIVKTSGPIGFVR